MNILITGATGFVGSHVTHELCNQGHSLIVGKRSTSDTWRIDDIIRAVVCVDFDNYTYDEIFSRFNVECIVHCATFYGRTGNNVISPIKNNLLFPLELLATGALHGVKYFINTDSFFSKKELMEDVPYMGGYSISKKQFLEYGKFVARNYGVKFINMRLEHVYGEKDNPDKFIPYIIKRCRENVPTIELSPGTQYRDFIHVSDVARAFSTVISCLPYIDEGFIEYGVGTGTAIPLKEFVSYIKEASCSSTVLEWGKIEMKPGEIQYSCADNKGLRKLGWELVVCGRSRVIKKLEQMFPPD